MARWIKYNGTEVEVHPKNGVEFGNQELHDMVEGFLTGVTLGGPQGLYMFMSDSSIVDGKGHNVEATKVLRQYRPGYPHEVYGNVVVASLEETGDE